MRTLQPRRGEYPARRGERRVLRERPARSWRLSPVARIQPGCGEGHLVRRARSRSFLYYRGWRDDRNQAQRGDADRRHEDEGVLIGQRRRLTSTGLGEHLGCDVEAFQSRMAATRLDQRGRRPQSVLRYLTGHANVLEQS